MRGLDRLAVACLLLGAGCVAARLLPAADAARTIRRILPLLVFLAAVIVLAELTAEAEVFDTLAARMARLAGGNHLALFLLCVAFAALTATFLNLDTTAVLLTPVMLATARKTGIPGMPLAMTTVWLANTASLLLPVSNLTNLLAANRVALPPAAFAARMLLPELAAVAATAACLWLFWWRPGRRPCPSGAGGRYTPPEPHTPADPVLFAAAAAACAIFAGCVLAGAPLPLATLGCAGLVAVAFRLRAPDRLRPALLPWRLLVFVTGLFLVVQTVSRHGLGTVVGHAVGAAAGTPGVLHAALTGAVLSNLINNLPTYVAGEAAVPLTHGSQLLGLLIGTNVGPIVTPWASLATLLWHERCRAHGLQISWRSFALTGIATAACVLAAALGGLLVSGHS
jgi:arsenical pump membrane protein